MVSKAFCKVTNIPQAFTLSFPACFIMYNGSMRCWVFFSKPELKLRNGTDSSRKGQSLVDITISKILIIFVKSEKSQ